MQDSHEPNPFTRIQNYFHLSLGIGMLAVSGHPLERCRKLTNKNPVVIRSNCFCIH